jgi:hypothetical protein
MKGSRVTTRRIGNKYFFKEFEDTFNTERLTSKKSKPYQSFFEFKDMVSLYSTEKGMCDDFLVP